MSTTNPRAALTALAAAMRDTPPTVPIQTHLRDLQLDAWTTLDAVAAEKGHNDPMGIRARLDRDALWDIAFGDDGGPDGVEAMAAGWPVATGKIVAIASDGRRPVVWGMGDTEADAIADATHHLTESGNESDIPALRTAVVSDERAALIEAGDVGAGDL